MNNAPDSAMIMAAGLGLRMRPLTLTTPKPLIKLGGKALIDYGLEKLKAAGVKNVVVNKHYLPDQIEAWAKAQTGIEIKISDESDQVLETGGGITRALPMLGRKPFYVLNSDCFWTEAATPALQRLSETWNDRKMDCLLLLCDPARTTGYRGGGDFVIESDGRLKRQTQNALVYIGAYIVHPRLFEAAPIGAFSMNVLWNKAIAAGRLYGIEHQGHWFDVGTPEGIPAAEAGLVKS
ncbi:MAG: nucleotidyltransferase family protein [Pseudomonadota bacterium]|nr:nucleotidyltransferase family protein [Pseudomonadota bacterium]